MIPGEILQDFLGVDQNGNEVSRSNFAGKKIILYAYPKANTSGCTAEACSLQNHKEELRELGYEIIGVSKDKISQQKKFSEQHNLEFTLISDPEATLQQILGCWGEKVACGRRTVGTLRTTYLIDENGKIEKIFGPKEIKTKIHAEQILEYLKK